MLFNLYFADIAILSYLFLFFLIIELYFLTAAVFARILNPTAGLVMSMGTPRRTS